MTGLFCGDFFVAVPASHLENRMTVCMGYPAMTPYRASRKTPPEGGRKSMQFCCFVLSRKDIETEIRKIIYSQVIYI